MPTPKIPRTQARGISTYRKSISGVMYSVKTLVFILERVYAFAVFAHLKVEMLAG